MTEAAVSLPSRPTRDRTPWIVFTLLLAGMVVFLRLQGRVWWCACGQWFPVSLNVNSSHNSQHLVDPYFLSHVLHGVIFFGLFWLLSGRVGLAWRFVLAGTVEMAWEMMENSPIVIDRYRTATVSLGYTGDSVLNSLGDVAGFALGFYLARRLGLWWSIGFCVITELLMLYWMRDNLTLNVLMLLWPIDAIRRWQAGA